MKSNFLKKFHASAKGVERKPRGEGIDIQPRIYAFLEIPELARWGDGEWHYFDRIEKEITENDGSAYGIPDLHKLGPKLRDSEWQAKDVLGNQLFFRYKRMEFWRPKKRSF